MREEAGTEVEVDEVEEQEQEREEDISSKLARDAALLNEAVRPALFPLTNAAPRQSIE